MPSRRSLLAAGLLLAAVTSVVAQAPPKRPLKHSDYEIWNTATGVSLSPDGKWLAYTLIPAAGDGHLVVRSTGSDIEHRIARGGRSGGDTPAGESAAPTPPVFASAAAFSPDGKRVFATLPPTKAEVEQAKTAKKRAESSLAVIETATGKVIERIAKVRTFEVAGDGAGRLLLQKEPKPEEQPSPAGTGAVAGGSAAAPMAPAAPPTGGRRFPRPGTQPPTPGASPTPTVSRPSFGTELVIRDLADGSERTVPDVTEYRLTRDHQLLVYAAASKKDDANGVYTLDLKSKSDPLPVRVGKGRYTRLTWDKKQTRLAFVFDETATPTAPTSEPSPPTPGAPPTTGAPPSPAPVSAARPSEKVKLYVWDRAEKKTTELLTARPPGIKDGFVLSATGNPRFTDDGRKLAVTVVPLPPETPKPAAAPTAAGDRVDLDIWHWKDELVQPMQRVRGPTDRVRSQPAAYFFDTKTFRQLGDDDRTAGVPDHGDWAVSNSDKAYRYMTGYGGQLNDFALVNVRTGEVKPVLTAAVNTLLVSPKGTAAVHFDGTHWHAVAVPSGAKKNLTGKLAVKFFNEEYDSPSEPPAYGFAGWTADESAALVYDRFDLWKLPVDGSAPTNVTAVGREIGLRLRLVRLRTGDDDEPGIDLSKPMLLAATNLNTLDTGFYRQEPGGKPKLLVMGARQYGTPVKAKSADTLLVTASTFFDAPDYYVTGPDFREFRRVTDIQPRKAEFNWGKAELLTYKTLDGQELKGMLVKPEDFDPTKKYPMIVYIYERLSQNLHQFRLPSAGTSINPTYYASNGYLVFMPDIAYTIGSPGQSAVKCVLPAIQSVVDKGYVNESAIGIQGHSWGGYQIAYMVTQTNRFKAAAAGAPVSDMVSAYGGIRWGTGLPRQFQYERTQSRIGAKLWDAPLKYIENSPIFHADRVKTPLLILHNDQDDAVPWYQGIEYYLALRRLGTECYLLNYNGEFHGLRKKATQRDYTLRMQQFFDHHLKGAPMPEWMAKGVPYSDREKEKEQWKGLFKPEGVIDGGPGG